MHDSPDVSVLRLGSGDGRMPLTDNAAALLAGTCCHGEMDAGPPLRLTSDPSLATWLACQLSPQSAELHTLAARISRYLESRCATQLSSSVMVESLSDDCLQAFRQWWLWATATRRLVGDLVGWPSDRDGLLDVMTVAHGSLPAEVVGDAEYRFDEQMAWLREATGADHRVVSIIQRAVSEVRDDLPRYIERFVLPAERQSVRSSLSPLHAALPRVLAIAAELDVLKTQFEQRLEIEKLLAVKELAYGASHEINNPLANISSRAQVLMRDEPDPERRRSLATINSQAFRAHEMIADMMLFAKPPSLNLEDLNVGRFIDSVLDQVDRDLPDGVRLDREIDQTEQTIRADPVQLTVAIQAICRNAVEAMEDQGRVAICVSPPDRREDSASEYVTIAIEDDGPGISAEVRRHLFDPFYSGREAGRGLGFGLAKAWRIMQSHGGCIEVESQPGRGAKFWLRCPVADTHSEKHLRYSDGKPR